MDEAEALGLFERCSNVGRWGPADQIGTLNHITDQKRIEAAREVVEGIVVPLGLPVVPSSADGAPITQQMLDLGRGTSNGALDSVAIAPHGFGITHMDALGHVLYEGRMYNGRSALVEIDESGMRFGSIAALAGGIFTRGVLLDVAAAMGVPFLPHGSAVHVEDLVAAERLAGVVVGQGDAMLVRTGHGRREAVEGPTPDDGRRTGLAPDCIPWIHERGIAVFGGDCVEQFPSPFPSLPTPLHQVGLVAMGLVFLDNPEVERLAEMGHRLGRSTFLLTCAPLAIKGGTGSAVNPLAIF